MDKKIGRNDPCPCGSGKKYKQCCWGKQQPRRQITAKWLNSPILKEMPNLIERTFQEAISSTDDVPPIPPHISEKLKKTEDKPLSET